MDSLHIVTQLFEYPEILYLICEQAQRSDLARLLTTSRLFFDCAVPFVWRSLPESAPTILMRLLPDSDTHLKHHLRNKFIKELQPLDSQSLVRFNLYVPHVKQLAQGLGSHRIWKKLLKLVGTRPILPNLQVLKVSILGMVQDPVSYLSACLTPTLTEIDYHYGGHPYVEPHLLSHFVSSIAQKCPNIHSLKLGYVARHITIGPTHASKLANALRQLHNLRVLGLGPVVLDPKVLSAISSLPNLESLTLNEAPNPINPRTRRLSSEEPQKRIEFSLSDETFPNLQHLGIDPCRELESVIRIWNITALVQRLMSVSIRIVPYISVPQLQFHRFIRAICRRSPFVSILSLSCSGSSNYIQLLSPEIVDNLAQLPLQRLRLWRDEHYDIFASASPRCDSEHFALAFSGMECLQIWGYHFTFKDLVFIAKHMSRLQQLWVTIEMDKDWPSKEKLSSLSLTPSPSQLYFDLNIVHTISANRRPTPIYYGLTNEKAEEIAAGLHALWPKGVVCDNYQPPYNDGRLRCTDEINTALRRLRGVHGDDDWAKLIPLKYPRKRIHPWLERF
ncbi:hypothetical protein OPQ81_010505 [Rhizoctonia solani]|nr:hypothetical protein OPQ81_010505 [Rhizoctonia solani]